VKSWVYLSQSIVHHHFIYAIADYLAAMIVVLLLEVKVMGQKQGLQSGQWIVAGIAVSALAIGVQAVQLTIAVLTPNDLYHLVQMIALYLFYRGASLL
jgi:acyl-coenzyme A thioesterase PaaI-like protein